MNPVDMETMHHAARLAFLAMAARAVGASEFDNDPEVHTLEILVNREALGVEASVDVTFKASNGMPMGGMSL